MNIPRPKLLSSLIGGVMLAAFTGQAAPIISNPTSPQTVSIRDGLSTSFTIEASSDEGRQLAYAWFKDGSVNPLKDGSGVSGASTKTLKIAGAKAANAGVYIAKVMERTSGTPEQISSESFTLTVLVRPKIATHPVAPTGVNQGDQVTFSVDMTPDTTTSNLTYQWQKNNVDIPASSNPTANEATFQIAAATPGNETTEGAQWQDAGAYRVKITSVLPTLPSPTTTVLFSKPASLKVNSQPVILVQPAAATGGTLYVAEKATGKLSVVAGGNPKLVYEWQKQDGGVFSDAVIGKASSLPVKEEGTYRVKVTNGLTPAGGGTFSNPAEVVILKKPTESAPITVESNKSPNAKGEYLVENEGEDAPFVKLTVNPSLDNTGDLEFQWQKDGKSISDGDGISGSQTAVLTLEPLSWLHRGVYRCVIKNKVGVLTSKTFVLKLNSKPIIVTEPEDLVGVSGKAVTFSVVAGGNAPLKYQWYSVVNSIPTELGKAAKQTVSKLSENSEGEYYCVVTNAFGQATTVSASLRVDEPAVISTQPGNTPVEVGGTLTLTISTSKGDGPITYQWQRNNKNLEEGGRISGALVTVAGPGGLRDSVLLRIENVELADAGSYRCIVTNVGGAVKLTSKTAKVTVLTPPAIAPGGDPVDVEGYEGETATFKVVATGSPKLKYQWQKAPADAPAGPYTDIAGATAATLILKPLRLASFEEGPMDGFYRCVVSNDTSVQAASVGAFLSVLPIPDAEVASITPKVARANEKVRVTGTNLNFIKEAKIGTAKAGIVKESDTSLLLTVPAGAPTEPSSIVLINTAGVEFSTDEPNKFTRSITQANDRFNPTIIVGTNFPATRGTIDSPLLSNGNPSGLGRGEAYYTWVFPTKGVYSVSLAANFHFSFGYIKNPLTEDELSLEDDLDGGQMAFVVNVEEDMTPVTIYVYGSLGNIGFLPDSGQYSLTVFKRLSSPVSPTVASDWEVDGASAAVTVESDDESAATLTASSQNIAPTVLWKDTSDLVYTDNSTIRTEWTMSISETGKGQGGHFAWQVSGSNGQPLGQLQFSVEDGAIYAVAGDGTREALEPALLAGSEHRFEINTDLANDTWQVRMDGVLLGNPRPLPANSGFGDVSAIWYPAAGGGKPAMSFENVTITVD